MQAPSKKAQAGKIGVRMILRTMVVVAGATGMARNMQTSRIGATAATAHGMGRIKLGTAATTRGMGGIKVGTAATTRGMGNIRLGAAATMMVGGVPRAMAGISGATGHGQTSRTTTMIPNRLPAGKQPCVDPVPLTSSIAGPHASLATKPSSRSSKS